VAQPVILFSTSSGSDTAASGAGPIPAISGTNAAHTGGSNTNVVTFTNSPNLSGVSSNGSAVLWLKRASGRQYYKITGVNNSAKTVTVEDLFQISSGSAVNYAIGGRRANFDHADNRRLFETDIKAGWIVETETDQTLTILISPTVGGSGVEPITLRGSTEFKKITWSPAGPGGTTSAFVFQNVSAKNWHFRNLQFEASTAAEVRYALHAFSSSPDFQVFNCKFVGSGLSQGIKIDSGSGAATAVAVIDCSFQNVSIGIDADGGALDVHGCYFNGSTVAIDIDSSATAWCVMGCVMGGNQRGIRVSNSNKSGTLCGCTINNSSVAGLDILSKTSQLVVINNIFSNCAIGVNAISGQEKFIHGIDFNNYYNNGTDRANFPIGPNDLALNPQYVNASANNYMIGTNLRAKGFPSASMGIGANQGITNSFVDIGAAQRQEAN
jgi:hypothetical protein